MTFGSRLCPFLAITVQQHLADFLASCIKRYLQRRPDWDNHAGACLALDEANSLAIILRPCKLQEVALPLASPQCQDQR